jgi:hypothetical protein
LLLVLLSVGFIDDQNYLPAGHCLHTRGLAGANAGGLQTYSVFLLMWGFVWLVLRFCLGHI